MRHLTSGMPAPAETLCTVEGTLVTVPDPGQILHLHFSRFADCPICNLHIADLRRRTPELHAAGIRPIAIFHSPPAQVLTYRADMPFGLIADPDRGIYARFGVGTSRRALLHPRAIRRLIAEARAGRRAQEAHGGIHGLPADFLIGRDGRLLVVRYGTHADDPMPVQDILDAVRSLSPPPPPRHPKVGPRRPWQDFRRAHASSPRRLS